MILSESEKNRIRGLYGLVTEAETTPPPDESVLVDKKNPFNDRNFEKARQPYRSSLKDGDLYVNIHTYKMGEFVKKQLSDLLVGKTFRMVSDDVIMKFGDINFVGLINWDKMNWLDISLNGNIGQNINIIEKIYFDEVNDNTFLDYIELFTYKGNSGVNKMVGQYVKNQKRYDAGYGDMDKMDEILKPFTLPNLPDEYFEIRKIQRKKTDF